jgi:hypothetical protein
MQDALSAVARRFPRLESLALPIDVFNALATREPGDDVAAGKAALRGALVAATPHCRTLKLLSRTSTPDGRVAPGYLHVEALQQLGQLLPHLRVLGPVAVSGTPPPLDVLPLLVDDAAVPRRAPQARERNGNWRRRTRVVKRAANSDTTAAGADDAGASASADCGDPRGQTTCPQRRARSALAADESRSLIAGNNAAAPAALDGAADPTPACAASANPMPLVAQLRELHVTGPVTRDELAAVTRVFPRLRVLQCEYGGPCPLDAPSPDSSAPPRDMKAAETAFVAWLGAVMDVPVVTHDCASSSATASTTAPVPPESAMPKLHELRRLRVERPPFDAERDAATMGALESLRAHSRVLIEFL